MMALARGLLMMTSFDASAAAVADPRGTAAITNIVESVAVLADNRNFTALEQLFADEVMVDYTSLQGGDPELKSPQTLMTEWAGLLPGFDLTRHNVSNVQVAISHPRAVATAEVVADHYAGDLHWQVSGNYRYELAKSGDQWHITAVTFDRTGEAGTRDIFEIAAEKAARSPTPYLARRQSQEIVRRFLTALEDKDMVQFASVWADAAVQDMPYSPKGHPKRVAGKDEILNLYSGWPETAGRADFTSQLVFYPMLDPQLVFAEFQGEVHIIPTGREYRQTYGGLFHVVNGKIALFREYYDPAPFAWAFGLDQH